MAQFEPHVVRHSDAATPHYSVRFIGDTGESVTVECRIAANEGEPGRDEIIEAAYEIVSRLADQSAGTERRRASSVTMASPGSGLSRPIEETEARTHTSEGCDRGTG